MGSSQALWRLMFLGWRNHEQTSTSQRKLSFAIQAKQNANASKERGACGTVYAALSRNGKFRKTVGGWEYDDRWQRSDSVKSGFKMKYGGS